MKIGDVVMFVDQGIYAKWFYGRMAVVESCRIRDDGQAFCRVRWLQPVPYFDKQTTVSSFNVNKFETFKCK